MTRHERIKWGYKQTDAGWIPDDWDVARIADVASITTGSRNTQDRVEDGAFRFFVRSQTVERINSYSFDGEAVLTAGDGVGTGKIFHYVNGKFDFHQRVYKISNFSEALNGYYFYIYFSNRFFDRIMSMTAKSSVDSVRREMIADMLIPLPPPEEQRAIAAALSDADARVASMDALIAKKRDLKQAVMQQLLSGRTRLPGFSAPWSTVTVVDVIERFFSGPSPTCEERNVQGETEWGVLKTTAITWENGWDWTKHKVLPSTYWGKHEIELRPGDVLVTKAGPRHRVGVTAWVEFVPKRILPSGKMIALRPDITKTIAPMLASAIAARDAQQFLDQRTTGMAESQVNFENGALLQTPILLPKIEEQGAIASVLSDAANELAALEAKRDKARALYQGMIQQLLTGRVRLV